MHRFREETRAFSSAGSEHLPYKQRVGGSNPSTPTNKYDFFLKHQISKYWAFSSAGSEHLPYKQRVGGSNPSTPTNKYDFFLKHQISKYWAFSSAGSEHLPYKQRVGGSNPSTPTLLGLPMANLFCCYCFFRIYERAMSVITCAPTF